MNAADFLRDLVEAMAIAGPSSPVRVVVNGDECRVEAVGHARGMVIVDIHQDTSYDPDELVGEIGDKDDKISGFRAWAASIAGAVEALIEFMDEDNEAVKAVRNALDDEPS